MSTILEGLRRTRGAFGVAALAMFAFLMAAGPAAAQRIPPDNVIEITIKRHLASFNDANISGNYEVWHTTLSRPFRQQFSPARLKTAFKEFHDKAIDIAPVLAERPILTKPARIDNEGALLLEGVFETRPSRVLFNLRLLPAEGEWKLIAIHVNVQPANEGAAPSAAGKM